MDSKIYRELIGTYIPLATIIFTGNAWLIGLAFAIVIYFFKGGNYNPAVTIMLIAAKKQPANTLVPYIIAQVIAGLAAWGTYVLFKKYKF